MWARHRFLLGCALTARLSSTALPQALATESLGRRWTDTRCGYKQTMAALTAIQQHVDSKGVVAVFDDGRAYAWHQLNETYQD